MSPTLLAASVDNPAIDQQWYAGELSALHARLAARYPTVAAEVVEAALVLATRRIAVPAKIATYLPVLVERDARNQLESHLAGTD